MDELCYSILMENVHSFKEKKELEALTEAESAQVSNKLLVNIMKSAVEKSHVDFGSIPKSKGRIEKYDGFENMKKSIDYMRQFAQASTGSLPQLDTVERAIENIAFFGDVFEKGFRFDNQLVIMTYNTLVMACVEATSGLLSTCMEFVQTPSDVEMKFTPNAKKPHSLCLDTLTRFNTSCMKGEMSQCLTALMNQGRKNFVGAAAIGAAGTFLADHGLKIAVSLLIVPILRECIYFFYNSRLKVSEYLDQQAKFIELAEMAMEKNNYIPADKRNKIIARQKSTIRLLRKISDKIDVNYAISEKKVANDISSENKGWSLQSIRNDISSQDESGFQLL